MMIQQILYAYSAIILAKNVCKIYNNLFCLGISSNLNTNCTNCLNFAANFRLDNSNGTGGSCPC